MSAQARASSVLVSGGVRPLGQGAIEGPGVAVACTCVLWFSKASSWGRTESPASRSMTQSHTGGDSVAVVPGFVGGGGTDGRWRGRADWQGGLPVAGLADGRSWPPPGLVRGASLLPVVGPEL